MILSRDKVQDYKDSTQYIWDSVHIMTWRGKVWFETLCVGACDTTRKPKKIIINNFKISLIALRESQSSIHYWYRMQRQEEDFKAKNRFRSFSLMVDISVDSDGTGGSSDDWRGRKRWERQVNIILKSWCLLMCLSLDVLIIVTIRSNVHQFVGDY